MRKRKPGKVQSPGFQLNPNSLLVTSFLEPLAQPRSPPENTSVERLMTRLYFISHSVESGIRTSVFGTAVCVYTIFWPFVFPLLTAFISLFMAFVLCFLFFVFFVFTWNCRSPLLRNELLQLSALFVAF